jgi:hypothetical protein
MSHLHNQILKDIDFDACSENRNIREKILAIQPLNGTDDQPMCFTESEAVSYKSRLQFKNLNFKKDTPSESSKSSERISSQEEGEEDEGEEGESENEEGEDEEDQESE